LLAVPMHQLALWKTIGAAAEPEAFVTVYPDTLPSVAVDVQQRVCPDPQASVALLTPQDSARATQMDELLGRLLLAQLRALGVFAERRPATLLPAYDRWLVESRAILVRQGYLHYDETRRSFVPISDTSGPAEDELADAWRRWDEHKGVWLANPDMR